MCLEKVPCMAIYIVKMGGLERLSYDVGFVSKTLPACAGLCLHTQALRLRTQAEGFLWPSFSKNRFFAH